MLKLIKNILTFNASFLYMQHSTCSLLISSFKQKHCQNDGSLFLAVHWPTYMYI